MTALLQLYFSTVNGVSTLSDSLQSYSRCTFQYTSIYQAVTATMSYRVTNCLACVRYLYKYLELLELNLMQLQHDPLNYCYIQTFLNVQKKKTVCFSAVVRQ